MCLHVTRGNRGAVGARCEEEKRIVTQSIWGCSREDVGSRNARGRRGLGGVFAEDEQLRQGCEGECTVAFSISGLCPCFHRPRASGGVVRV